MKKLNSIISGITAVSLCTMSLIPVTYTQIFAEETVTEDENLPEIEYEESYDPDVSVSGNLKYKITDGSAEILGVLDDSIESIDIPDKISGITVTSIGAYAFYDCKKIKKFKLPDTLEMIGLRAFANTDITEIDIPDSVKEIYPEAFNNCKNLESIDLSGNMGMLCLDSGSFENCISLSKLILPKTIDCISTDAFHGCTSLTDIVFPESINDIYSGAFRGCTAITELNLPEKTGIISNKAFEGCTGISKITISENTDFIANDAFAGCSSVKKVIIKSSHIDFDFTDFSDDTTIYLYSNSPAYKLETANNVKYVLLDDQKENFRYKKTDDQICINGYIGEEDSVIVPETIEGLPVTQINHNAFENNSFSEITIPDCVKSIGEYAFSNCANLKCVKLPDGLDKLKDYVFTECKSLEKINIPSSVNSIDEHAFLMCSDLKEINIPENLEKLGNDNNNIFGTCNCLSSVTVDENNKDFSSDDGVLYNKDKTILICYPRGKAQESFVVPENVTEINYRGFDQCENLKNVKITGDRCILSDVAFRNCPVLVSVDIGKSEGAMAACSFAGCPLLKMINVSDDNKAYSSQTQNGMLLSKDMTELIVFFPGYEDNECIIPDSIEKIDQHAFFQTQNLKTLVLPEAINYINNYICLNCDSIEKVIVQGSDTTIDKNSFSGCSNLTCFEFGKNINKIDMLSFLSSYTNVEKIVIKNPECIISDIKKGDPHFWKSLIYGLTIFSYVNSSSEKYCQQNDINFSPLNEENDDMVIYGDLDGDKSVDLSDIIMFSQYLLHDIDFNQAQKTAADVEYDGYVDIADLARLKQYIMKDDIKLGK